MITRERYGVRPDGRPVTEVSTYIPIEPDHPLAVEIEGEDGFWVRTSVGNSLTAMGAQAVSRQEFQTAVEEAELIHESMMQELADRQARIDQEIEAKRDLIRSELLTLGLSNDAVTEILRQVRR